MMQTDQFLIQTELERIETKLDVMNERLERIDALVIEAERVLGEMSNSGPMGMLSALMGSKGGAKKG